MNDDKLCIVCQRTLKQRMNAYSECSHVDCPIRPKAWSDKEFGQPHHGHPPDYEEEWAKDHGFDPYSSR